MTNPAIVYLEKEAIAVLSNEEKEQFINEMTQKFLNHGNLELAAQATLIEQVGKIILEKYPEISSELFQFSLTLASVALEKSVKEEDAERLSKFSAQSLMATLKRYLG